MTFVRSISPTHQHSGHCYRPVLPTCPPSLLANTQWWRSQVSALEGRTYKYGSPEHQVQPWMHVIRRSKNPKVSISRTTSRNMHYDSGHPSNSSTAAGRRLPRGEFQVITSEEAAPQHFSHISTAKSTTTFTTHLRSCHLLV